MVRVLVLSCLLLTRASQSTQGSCEGDSCLDVGKESSVLMQRKNRRAGGQLPLAKQAIAEKTTAMTLFQATAQLLRDGANPDVIQFTNDTLEALNTEIIPNLLKGYDDDTALLNKSFARVEQALESFEHNKASLQPLREAEAAAIGEHRSCRQNEQLACDQHETCTESCQSLNTTYISTETDYLAMIETIHHQWCELHPNKSAPTWRTSMSERFERYITLGERRIEEWEALESCVTHCETKKWSNAAHEATVVDSSGESVTTPLENPCDTKQRLMERASCSAEVQRTIVNAKFDSEWYVASTSFEDVVATVKTSEEMRHRDFKALKGIKCLLKHIIDRAGKPCDEAEEPGEAEHIIDDCESYWQIDVHYLLKPWNVTYPEMPARPEPVPAEPHPCTEEWSTAQYEGLSGKCFNLPACEACPVIVTDDEHPLVGR